MPIDDETLRQAIVDTQALHDDAHDGREREPIEDQLNRLGFDGGPFLRALAAHFLDDIAPAHRPLDFLRDRTEDIQEEAIERWEESGLSLLVDGILIGLALARRREEAA